MKKNNKKRKLKYLYNATAEFYNRRYQEIQKRKFQRITSDLIKVKRILDVGCGTGLLIDELARDKHQIVGVDLSSKMLRKAKRHEGGVTLISADADKLPFKDESFDAVVSVTLLQNMPNPKHAVREMARVAKQGGIIAITSLKHKHSANQVRSWVVSANLKPLHMEEIPNSEDVLCIARREM